MTEERGEEKKIRQLRIFSSSHISHLMYEGLCQPTKEPGSWGVYNLDLPLEHATKSHLSGATGNPYRTRNQSRIMNHLIDEIPGN